MGYYRLILAIMVLFSHCGLKFPQYNQGVTAVVSFFIISGYVITKLIFSKFPFKENIHKFYLDRALRLFPQFLFYLTLTVLMYLYFDGVSKVSMSQFLVNSTMLPLNSFAVYFNDYIIVPQSWSLGLELQFYLLIPLILLSGKKLIFACLSLFLFIPAYIGLINTDYFGYRMLSGTLFIFLLGSMLAQNERKLLCVIYVLTAILFMLSITLKGLSQDFNKEVLSGIIIGIPVVAILFRLNLKNRYDRLAGDLSYGVYLNHLMFFYLFNKLGFDVISFKGAILILASSLTMSYISLRFIERPCYRLRHRLIRKDFSDAYTRR